MIIQMGITGRSVYMSVESYLALSDEDINQMIAFDQGSVFNHPFIDTALIDICEEEYEEEEDTWENEDQTDRDLFDQADIEELMESESVFDS